MKPLNHNFLPLRPRMIISLWDMLQFLASEPENTVWKLNHAAFWAGEQMAEKGAQAKATSEEIKKILQWFVQIEQFCDKLKLNDAKNRADLFKAFLENEMECYYTVFQRDFDGIKYAIQKELENRSALLLSHDEAKLFEQENLFDIPEKISFEINSEIKMAGNCLAVALNIRQKTLGLSSSKNLTAHMRHHIVQS